MTHNSKTTRRSPEQAIYVIQFASYTNPRQWLRSFDHGAPFGNPAIAQQVADEAAHKSGDKYRVVKYVRDWSASKPTRRRG